MRQAFAHEAVLLMGTEQDEHAPGAAITVELCGHWEHEPPCPLAPHHTSADRRGADVWLRTLFAVEAQREAEVRARIDEALAGGRLTGPDGRETSWGLVRSAPSALLADEADHAERLAAT